MPRTQQATPRTQSVSRSLPKVIPRSGHGTLRAPRMTSREPRVSPHAPRAGRCPRGGPRRRASRSLPSRRMAAREPRLNPLPPRTIARGPERPPRARHDQGDHARNPGRYRSRAEPHSKTSPGRRGMTCHGSASSNVRQKSRRLEYSPCAVRKTMAGAPHTRQAASPRLQCYLCELIHQQKEGSQLFPGLFSGGHFREIATFLTQSRTPGPRLCTVKGQRRCSGCALALTRLRPQTDKVYSAVSLSGHRG